MYQTPGEFTSRYSAVSDDSLPPIFALVIGINVYNFLDPEYYPRLTGARADADRFEKYLLDELKVPPNNIRNLRDEDATRDNIIAAFYALQTDPRFTMNEAAIIIYFAGHGARAEKPEDWTDWVTVDGQIEIMCPSDMFFVSANGEVVVGIPDRTISNLLNHISDLKGNNITLVLDCCSSGGLNRGSESSATERYVPRYIPNAPPIPSTCDAGILSKVARGTGVAGGFSGKHHASHVLLAACGSKQSAWEDSNTNSGVFTTNLLKTLSTHHIDGLTYTSLMHRLPMHERQTPHCEGRYVDRRLFNHRVTGTDGTFILGQRKMGADGSYQYVLNAGAAQGIAEGSSFGVHATDLVPNAKHSNPVLANCVVLEIREFESTITLHPDPPSFLDIPLFYCKLIRLGTQAMNIYCEDRQWLESVFTPAVREHLPVSFADSPDTSYLQLHLANGKVSFTRNDPLITQWLGSEVLYGVAQDDVGQLWNIVGCIIHFDHHLKRTSPHNFNNAWMELKKLESRYGNHDFTTTGPNLIENDPADIVVNEEDRLGMTIHNRTDTPLYPYLFYFDPTDFSITEWYRPPLGTSQTPDVDPPLPQRGSLAIGYGSGGVSPWEFLLRDGQEIDVGFFKLFLTTSPTDFSSIPQGSPFEGANSIYSRKGAVKAVDPPDSKGWGSILSTVRQVRYERQLLVHQNNF